MGATPPCGGSRHRPPDLPGRPAEPADTDTFVDVNRKASEDVRMARNLLGDGTIVRTTMTR